LRLFISFLAGSRHTAMLDWQAQIVD
jgi:hypothetical protein